MEEKLRNQLLAESGIKEEEVETVNLEIEEREVSENGIFVLVRNKNNKWVITTCGALVNGKEFDTKEDAEKHLAKKEWGDILITALVFFKHATEGVGNIKEE